MIRFQTLSMLALLLGGLFFADDRALAQTSADDRIRALEERLLPLEEGQEASGGGASWLERFHFSGSANAGFVAAGSDSFYEEGSFLLRDARLFVDVALERDVRVGSTTIARDVGFSFELNAVRRSETGDDQIDGLIGETYIELRGLLDSDWLSLQVGRVQLPLGESYLRYSRGYGKKPFVSDTIGGPWYWDEGVRLFGGPASGRYGYVASLTDGENSFNGMNNQDVQYTLKLYATVTSWLYVSASGMWTGETGTPDDASSNSLWLGEMFPAAFGSRSNVDNYDGGIVVPDGPNQLDRIELIGADVIVRPDDHQRIWLAYGVTTIESDGSRIYDRRLIYWIAEYVVEGELFSTSLAPFYFGVRANGLGTYHDEEGYFIDQRLRGDLGYNVSATDAYSAVVGWRIGKHATLRAEYTSYQINLVSGVTADLRAAADDADYFLLELGIDF